MKKTGIFFVCLLLIGRNTFSQAPSNRDQVFFIQGYNEAGEKSSSGSGVFLDNDRAIALIRSFKQLSSWSLFTLDSSVVQPQKVTGYDDGLGLILFTCSRKGRPVIPAIPTGKNISGTVNAEVVAAPGITSRLVIPGEVSAGENIPGFGIFLSMTNTARDLPDGTPVYLDDSSLAGIILAGLDRKNGLELVIPGSYVEKLNPVNEDFREFIKANAASWNNYFARGLYEFGKGDWNAAYHDFQFSSQRLKNNFIQNSCNGLIALQRNDPSKAIGFFDLALKSSPDNPEILEKRGTAIMNSGDYAKAMTDLNRSAALGNQSPELLYCLGYCQYNLGNFNEASNAFGASVKSGSKDPAAFYYLGLARFKSGNTKEAETAMERSLALGFQPEKAVPELAEIYFREKEYRKVLGVLAQSPPGDSAQAWFWTLSGQARIGLGDLSAIHDFNKAYSLGSGDTTIILGLATIYLELDSVDQAISYYQSSIRAGADNARINNLLGEAWMKKGNLQEAKKYFDKAIGLSPGWYLPYLDRGSLSYRAGDNTTATNDLDKARQLGADERDILEIRGMANYETGRMDLAYYDLTRAAEEGNFHDPKAWFYLARVQYGRNLFTSALANLDKGVSGGFDHASASSLRGKLEYKLLNYSGAFSDLTRAIRRGDQDPGNYYFRGMAGFIVQNFLSADSDLTVCLSKGLADSMVFKNLGIIAMASQSYERATEYFTRAMDSGLSNPTMYNRRGLAWEGIKDYQKAIADFSQAITLDNGYVEAYYNRSHAENALENIAAASADKQRAYDISQAQRSIFVLQGFEKFDAGDYAGAVTEFQRARSMGIENGRVFYGLGNSHFYLGNYEVAVRELDQAVNAGEFDQRLFTNRGIAKYNLKNIDDAMIDLKRAIDLGSQDPEVFRFTGLCYSVKEDYKNAVENLTEAIHLKKGYREAFADRGDTWFRQASYLAAIADYDTAISLGLQDPIIYNNRGKAYAMLGHYEPAIDDYNQALELNPGYSRALENRAEVRYKVSDFTGCITDCRSLESRDLASSSTYYLMGESEYAMNHYGQAESWFQESINQGNTDKEVYFRKGICNLENKIYSRAVNDFSMALLKDSSNARGLIFRAQSYIGVGEYELARDDLSRAREIEPDNPDIYFNRAQLFENFRDYDRAILDYSRVIRLRPDDHFAYYSRGRDRVIMGEYVPALNDLDKALSLNDSIPEYLRTRGDIKYQINRLVSDPCSDWLAAAQMGDKNARFSMDKYCK